MLLEFVEIAVSIAIFLFIFFAIFLFVYRKGDQLTKNLLAFFFLSLGLAITDIYFLTSGTYTKHPNLAFILNSIPLAYGPLLWLLTKSVSTYKNRFQAIDLLHFIPLLTSIIIFLFIYHIKDLDYKIEFLNQASSPQKVSAIFSSLLVFISIAVYLFFCFKKVQSYRKKIKEQYSNIDKVNLSWLMHTLIGFSMIMILSIFLQLANFINHNRFWFYIFLTILLFAMLIFIMSSIVKGLNSDVLISESFIESNKHTNILEIQDNELLNSIVTKIKTDELYLDSNLLLKSLAEQLNIHPRSLSSLINRGLNQSFFDFINSFRIDHAKSQIKESPDPKLTILEVMYASGFNSKSSFNTAFKKHAGCTPTEWRRKLK